MRAHFRGSIVALVLLACYLALYGVRTDHHNAKVAVPVHGVARTRPGSPTQSRIARRCPPGNYRRSVNLDLPSNPGRSHRAPISRGLIASAMGGAPTNSPMDAMLDSQMGEDGILWVPETAKSSQDEPDMKTSPSMVKEVVRMPLFPLSTVYLPNSKEILNIFEQRYRKMYNDILHTGSKRFAVALTANGRISEYGVSLHIDDIQDVSVETNDQIKYRCTHTVRERIRILRIMNPEALKDASKFLQVEVEVLIDEDEKDDVSVKLAQEGDSVKKQFTNFVELQSKYNETVRFTQDIVKDLSMDREGLWKAVGLWKTFVTQLMIQKERDLQAKIADIVKDHFTSIGKPPSNNEPIRVNFDELPKHVQDELNFLTQQFQDNSEMMGAGPYPFQRMLQLNGHRERLDMFRKTLTMQTHRLMAIGMLRNLGSMGGIGGIGDISGVDDDE